MIRFIAVLVVAAIGFAASAPAGAQSDEAPPVVVATVAPDGTIVVVPPAGTAPLSWINGSASGLSWSDAWWSAATGPIGRQLARQVLSEGSPQSVALQNGTSVIFVAARQNPFAACIGCGGARSETGPQNRTNASHALPQDFANPIALSKPHAPAFVPAAAKTVLDFPKPNELKKKAPLASAASEEKPPEGANAKNLALLASATPPAENHGKAPDAKGAKGPVGPLDQSSSREKPAKAAKAKALVESSGQSAVQPVAALSGPSIQASASNIRGGGAGQVPEPGTLVLTLAGLFGASLLRRRKK